MSTFGSALRCDCHKDPAKAAVTSTMYYRNTHLDFNVTFVFHHKRVEARYPIGWGHPSVLTAPDPNEPMWYDDLVAVTRAASLSMTRACVPTGLPLRTPLV